MPGYILFIPSANGFGHFEKKEEGWSKRCEDFIIGKTKETFNFAIIHS